MNDQRNPAAVILKHARARVYQGWCQHRGEDNRGGVCAGRAIVLAYRQYYGIPAADTSVSSDTYEPMLSLLRLAAQELTTLSWPTVPFWNDDPRRTKQEVLDTFDHAIKLAERDAA